MTFAQIFIYPIIESKAKKLKLILKLIGRSAVHKYIYNVTCYIYIYVTVNHKIKNYLQIWLTSLFYDLHWHMYDIWYCKPDRLRIDISYDSVRGLWAIITWY